MLDVRLHCSMSELGYEFCHSRWPGLAVVSLGLFSLLGFVATFAEHVTRDSILRGHAEY